MDQNPSFAPSTSFSGPSGNAAVKDEMYLPKGLKSLSFGFEFNKRLDRISLPSSLESLAFGYCFNKPLEHLKLPDGLKSLTLGSNFQQSLEFVELPNMLQPDVCFKRFLVFYAATFFFGVPFD